MSMSSRSMRSGALANAGSALMGGSTNNSTLGANNVTLANATMPCMHMPVEHQLFAPPQQSCDRGDETARDSARGRSKSTGSLEDPPLSMMSAREEVGGSTASGSNSQRYVSEFYGNDRCARYPDVILPDLRGSRISERRDNAFGCRAWYDACPNGYRMPQQNPKPGQLSPKSWLNKWTSHDTSVQNFGYPHRRDADYPNPKERPATLLDTMQEDAKKPSAYGAPAYNAYMTVDEIETLAAKKYPGGRNWKLNAYGINQLPCRNPGGISTWLPSKSDFMWSVGKMCPATEATRVMNPRRDHRWLR